MWWPMLGIENGHFRDSRSKGPSSLARYHLHPEVLMSNGENLGQPN